MWGKETFLNKYLMFVTPDYSSADPRSNLMGGQYSYDTSSNASN